MPERASPLPGPAKVFYLTASRPLLSRANKLDSGGQLELIAIWTNLTAFKGGPNGILNLFINSHVAGRKGALTKRSEEIWLAGSGSGNTNDDD